MLTALRNRLHDEQGVTLIEVLVVMILMGVIGGTVTTSLVRAMKTTATTEERFTAIGELQKAVGRMSRELRAADPVLYSSSTSQRAVVETYRGADFAQRLRFTYTYCPTQKSIHVRREAAPAGLPGAATCPSADPVLIRNVVNGQSVAPAAAGSTPVFRFLKRDGLTPATAATDVVVLEVRVRRALPNQPAARPIEVTTAVRLRNVR